MSDAARTAPQLDLRIRRYIDNWNRQVEPTEPAAMLLRDALAEVERLRVRAIVAENHKALSLLGKSSYQEVVEEQLRIQLAESQVECERLRAALEAVKR